MRKSLLLFTLGASALAGFAQDAVEVDAKHFRVEYQDPKMRAVREILPAGETAPMHSHPERITVVVRGAKLRITDASGKTEFIDAKPGEVAHLDPQTHTVTNVGSTVFEEVSTEFVTPAGKQPPDAIVPSRPNETAERAPVIETPAPRASSAPDAAAQPPAAVLPSTPTQPPPAPASVASQLEERVTPTLPIKGAKGVVVNGQQLTYIESGQGEPLILVHDAATDLRSWAQQIDEFAKHYRVIAYSRRYHYPNSATGKENDYTFQQHAADLLELIKQLNLGRAHVIGHAYGAAVATLAAIQDPQSFRSLTVMEPPLESLLPQLQADAARYARNQILSIVRREILKRHNMSGAMQTFVDWSRTSGAWDAMNADARQRYIENGNAVAAYSAHPEAPEFRCEDGNKITVPTLVVTGSASAPNNHIIGSTLAECIPNAKRAVVPKAAHWMHRESPAEFNQAVLEFLGSVK